VTVSKVLFIIFGVLAVFGGIGAITRKNIVHALLLLVFTFLNVAAIFFLTQAYFLAMVQILVYAGAIMVLFLFVIMLLSLSDEDLGVPRMRAMQVIGALGAVGVVALVVRAVAQAGVQPMRSVNPETFGTVKEVGRILFRDYLLPFEATSVLLLVAIVGAVIVAKQKV